jgi:methyl-accepting chemotaxis protein
MGVVIKKKNIHFMLEFVSRLLDNRTSKIELKKTIDLSFCFAAFSVDGIIQDCNQNFVSLFGFNTPKDLIGKHHQNLVEESYRQSSDYTNFWKDLGAGKTLSGEFHRKTKTGNSVYIQASYTPIKDKKGKVTGVVKIASDITEQKKSRITSQAIKNAIDLSFAFIRFDADGNILQANENFVHTMGYDRLEQIQGKHHSLFVSQQYKNSPEYIQFWQHLKEGKVQKGEFERVTKTGENIWLQASYSPVKNELGKVDSVVKIAANITNQKGMADNLKSIQNTIDLSFGFIQFNAQGYITEVNDNFYTLLGYSSKIEILGKHHSIFMSSEVVKSDQYKQFWQSLNNGITQKGEFQRYTKQGKVVWIQAAYTPIKNNEGKVVSVIKIASDITANKNASQLAKRDLRLEVFNNVQEISSAIEQIASGAKDQANKTDETSGRMEEALKSSTDVAQRAKLITDVANTAAVDSREGEFTVVQMLDAMNELNDVAQHTQRSMVTLANGTVEIARVLKVIKEIASQTNLLALNASIEAAQAGDTGRGFAVIASEVRKLAESSANSAKEIEVLVNTVQNNTDGVSNAMRQVIEKVTDGHKASSLVKEIIQKMSQSTFQASELSDAILGAAEKQTSDIKEIVKNIEDIVVIAEETATAAEQVAVASVNLKGQVERY